MMLRDRLVCGVNHLTIQKRLLAEKNQTFEKALEVALAVEAADNDVKQLQKPAATVMYQTHSKNQCTPRSESTTHRPAISPRSPCYRCLGNHTPQTCNFKEAECHKCKKWDTLQKHAKQNKTLDRNHTKELEGHIMSMTLNYKDQS